MATSDTPAEAQIDPWIGKIVDVYLITSLIGEGGMGRVYQALHQRLDRLVAFKILPAHLMYDEMYKMRFQKEARAAARLNHPNIVQIYDFNDDDGINYMVMEYIEGKNLKEILEKEGPLPSSDAIDLLIQACHALAHAHEAGVVHRDIKPDNFILSDLGFLKLADLGLAKIGLQGDLTAMGMTQTGSTLGTPYYISPEQVQADPADHRTDIYSLGASFYHMVAGVPPFTGKSSPLIMAKHLHEMPPDPRSFKEDIDPVLSEILLFMLEKSPDKRPQSIMEVCHRLETHQRSLAQQSYQKQMEEIEQAQIQEAQESAAPAPEPIEEKVSTPVVAETKDKAPDEEDSSDSAKSKGSTPKTKPAAEAVPTETAKTKDASHFPHELFQDLVQELRFILGEETDTAVDNALDIVHATAQSLKSTDYDKFARELIKGMAIPNQRDKMRVACQKIWTRYKSDSAESSSNEPCLSLLYITQLRRLVKKLSKDPVIDIVDQCIDILDLHPRKIPVRRKDELLDEIEHQMGSIALKKQFRTEVQFITHA